MADDGMLLNFSIPESGIIAKPSIKGGSWKSRLTAKKAAQNWHTKATARLNGEVLPKKAQKAAAPAKKAAKAEAETADAAPAEAEPAPIKDESEPAAEGADAAPAEKADES